MPVGVGPTDGARSAAEMGPISREDAVGFGWVGEAEFRGEFVAELVAGLLVGEGGSMAGSSVYVYPATAIGDVAAFSA